ncbi:zinc finger BED domain-containing protein 1 [Sinocyclocheilus anshuiensis]|uniref:zinc finger BED domain-containing protein 1 n=1 Tax=Sinocyclocheilus anshuiensis TaxID=1608454 RepID=UPI0007B7C50C|nr:PREDICTED: zinc finger BED domain-containing protein 1-like [Sinocyclocheilus anshuiensis]
MATTSVDVDIEEAPSSFKSEVWRHFGFPKTKNDSGDVVDKRKTVCKHCKKTFTYINSTTNMMQHINRHHSEKLQSQPSVHKKLLIGQTTLTGGFAAPLAPTSARAAEITRCIGVFMGKDMRPFSVVENEGFRLLLNTLEPRYQIPSRPHFSQTVMPTLYRETKSKVVEVLRKADSVSITTDSWTSRATQGYLTVTAHVITSEWEMDNFVLQTRPLFETHTGANIAEVLKSAVSEWGLQKASRGIAVVTDNARNMDVAVREAGLAPHVRCFAHTLNLASQAGLSVPRVSHLLGRIRRIVAFFHRSATATAALVAKQILLELPAHKLIIDVTTRWNSSLDMIERYLEQQAAVTATLLSNDVRRNVRDIDTLDGSDIRDAEDIVRLLKPLKTATTVLCDEKNPTVSLIVPLKHMIEQNMASNEEDSLTVSNIKRAILNNLSNRYTLEYSHLLECTVLDPRFRALPHLEKNQREDVFHRLKEKAVLLQNQDEGEEGASGHPPASQEPLGLLTDSAGAEQKQPPPKKTALEDFVQKREDNKTILTA